MLFLLTLQVSSTDTLTIRPVDSPPTSSAVVESGLLGPPQVRIRTGQGLASVWLLRAADTVYVNAQIPDSTRFWGDDFVMSVDTRGDGAPDPQHDDFQLYLRRTLDSSVVYRGRTGRWEPPRDDPDWRLGRDRAGGGWEVTSRDGPLGWSLLLRMDPAWFRGEVGQLPRVAFRVYDDSPAGWFTWPSSGGLPQPASLELAPYLWSPIR